MTIKKITTKEETWTPQRAKALLGKGGPNRRLNIRMVKNYAAAMKEGKWSMNGETIKISRAGKLLDGQHRLEAVVVSGKAIQILTVRGLQPRTQATIDDGMKRSLNHVLDIAGEKNATTLSFSLSLIKRWELSQLHTVRSRGETLRPRRDECMAMLKKHPDIRHYVGHKFTFNFRSQIASGGLFAFCWYVCSRANPDLADLFYEQLSLGVAMGAEDPVYHLRERLLRSKLTEDPRYKLDTLHKMDLIAKCWRATVDERPMKQLKLSDEKTLGKRTIEF